MNKNKNNLIDNILEKQRTWKTKNASLETRMPVVASLEVSNSRECGGSIWAGAMTPGGGRVDLD